MQVSAVDVLFLWLAGFFTGVLVVFLFKLFRKDTGYLDKNVAEIRNVRRWGKVHDE